MAVTNERTGQEERAGLLKTLLELYGRLMEVFCISGCWCMETSLELKILHITPENINCRYSQRLNSRPLYLAAGIILADN
uniref:Uncharacterized protein n=1 Tax=Tetranychus urticae TaxID=32264 RepID=T1K443_TETUR